jgi:hypothetical protein
MKLVDGGKDFTNSYESLDLYIALIPKEAKLSSCSGDDWNDTPASSNASGIYTYPKGTIFLKGVLGGELELKEDL